MPSVPNKADGIGTARRRAINEQPAGSSDKKQMHGHRASEDGNKFSSGERSRREWKGSSDRIAALAGTAERVVGAHKK